MVDSKSVSFMLRHVIIKHESIRDHSVSESIDEIIHRRGVVEICRRHDAGNSSGRAGVESRCVIQGPGLEEAGYVSILFSLACNWRLRLEYSDSNL